MADWHDGEYAEQARKALLEREGLSTQPLSDYLRNKFDREKSRNPLEPLGYSLRKFKKLNSNIDGLQVGFYIIGGETNVGKTALLTNLFLDVLESNPETVGLYFSLDDPRDVIVNRFLSIKTGLDLNQIQRPQANAADQERIEKYYEWLIELGRTKRIEIKDISGIRTIKHLEQEIEARAGEKIFVCVDGLYNLDVDSDFTGIRELNVERANKIKALIDTYKIPLIATAELRKRPVGESKEKRPTVSDLMETSKIAYNGTLILLLSPHDSEKFKKNAEADLFMDFAKNKLSSFRGYDVLRFVRAKGIVEEREIKPFDS